MTVGCSPKPQRLSGLKAVLSEEGRQSHCGTGGRQAESSPGNQGRERWWVCTRTRFRSCWTGPWEPRALSFYVGVCREGKGKPGISQL